MLISIYARGDENLHEHFQNLAGSVPNVQSCTVCGQQNAEGIYICLYHWQSVDLDNTAVVLPLQTETLHSKCL